MDYEYNIYAINNRTNERSFLGYEDSFEEAMWDLNHRLEWDDDDNIFDYSFSIVETAIQDSLHRREVALLKADDLFHR